MRVISGKARGTKIYTLDEKITRPTLDRVKESIFNIIMSKLEDCIFVDLFAGSGAIGIEAASRGAKKVIFCDKSKQAIEIINKNLDKTHLSQIAEVYNCDYTNCLNMLKQKEQKPDIIYIDPPYALDLIENSINEILKMDIIDSNTLIILETDDEARIMNFLENKKDLKISDKRKYGRADIIFITKN